MSHEEKEKTVSCTCSNLRWKILKATLLRSIVGEITTGTEQVKLEEGGTRSVSTIEMKLVQG